MAFYTIYENSPIREYFEALRQPVTFYEFLSYAQSNPGMNMIMHDLDPQHIPLYLLAQLKVQVYLLIQY